MKLQKVKKSPFNFEIQSERISHSFNLILFSILIVFILAYIPLSRNIFSHLLDRLGISAITSSGLHIDKIVHLVFFFTLTLLISHHKTKRTQKIYFILILLGAVADEWLQSAFSYRSSDFFDWFADFIGTSLAYSIVSFQKIPPRKSFFLKLKYFETQSYLWIYHIRKWLILFLYKHTNIVYSNLFKRHKKAWNLSITDFRNYPAQSLGYELYNFYTRHNIYPISKLEPHDVFHVLSGIGVNVEDEIALQFFLMGNGKFSPYLLGAIVLGSFIMPEYIPYYFHCYKKGKTKQAFFKYHFLENLDKPKNHFISVKCKK